MRAQTDSNLNFIITEDTLYLTSLFWIAYDTTGNENEIDEGDGEAEVIKLH